MRILILICIFVLSITRLVSQNTIEINGIIYDSLTNETVEYVNAGIFDAGIGTVSDDKGVFSLSLPLNEKDNLLTLSRIGYKQKQVKISNLNYTDTVKILLKPEAIKLKEVSVNAKKLKTKIKGTESRSKNIVLGISSALALGKETGTVIRLPDKDVWIKNFNFHIVYNRPDSAIFRLNIYEYDGEIGNNILKKNIYFKTTKDQTGDFQVDLTDYDIIAHNDIFVSVEVLKLYSNGPDPSKKHDEYYYDRINISGKILSSKSYGRKISLDKWEKLPMNFSPGFWLTVAY